MGSPRAAVLRFAGLMERKLVVNDGVKPGWRTESDEFLLRRLRDEVEELAQALIGDVDRDVTSEAADVSNIAMMLADKRMPSLGDRGHER